MRFAHFEKLRPVCPHCRLTHKLDYPLKLTTVIDKTDEVVLEGVLNCSNPACQLEYPIIDGIPIIVPNIRTYIADNLYQISMRDDLSATIESMLGDCVGPGTHFDAGRQNLSSYTWGHYGDLDSETADSHDAETPGVNSLVSNLNAGLGLLEPPVQSPMIDIGCAVGRSTFELSEKYDALVLGVDLNFSMLRTAQKILRNESQNYPLRRVGLVYDQRALNAAFTHSGQVDFWACDATALPMPGNSFGFVSALNVLDSVASPHELLLSISDCLMPSGWAILACPYDWSSAVTPFECWIGGHSQRSETGGQAEPLLRTLLTPQAHPLSLNDLRLKGEIENQPWTVRLHDRSKMVYSVHVVAAQKQASG